MTLAALKFGYPIEDGPLPPPPSTHILSITTQGIKPAQVGGLSRYRLAYICSKRYTYGVNLRHTDPSITIERTRSDDGFIPSVTVGYNLNEHW